MRQQAGRPLARRLRAPLPRRSLGRRGFSLIEVVIAVGIFAGAVVVILALFGPLNRSIGEVADTSRAARLAEAINAELLRIRDVQAPTSGTKLDAVAALVNGGTILRLVASTDGSHVVWETNAANDPVTGSPPGIALRDRYYLIEVRAQPAPLNYTAGTSAFLALTATIKWPYQVATGPGAGDATAADLTQAQTLLLNYALPP
jgi:prepilin-type N-terminal cleavage/methylation domain-containing protein